MPDVWDAEREAVDEGLVGIARYNSTPLLGGRHMVIVHLPHPQNAGLLVELAVYADGPVRAGAQVLIPREQIGRHHGVSL